MKRLTPPSSLSHPFPPLLPPPLNGRLPRQLLGCSRHSSALAEAVKAVKAATPSTSQPTGPVKAAAAFALPSAPTTCPHVDRHASAQVTQGPSPLSKQHSRSFSSHAVSLVDPAPSNHLSHRTQTHPLIHLRSIRRLHGSPATCHPTKPQLASSWTFQTKYPRQQKKSAVKSTSKTRKGKTVIQQPSRKVRNAMKAAARLRRKGVDGREVPGLVLPSRLRLDHDPSRHSKSLSRDKRKSKSRARPAKPERLSPQEALARAQQQDKARAWKEKREAHENKFAMTPLEASFSARQRIRDQIKASREFLVAGAATGAVGADGSRETAPDQGESADGLEPPATLREDVFKSLCSYLGTMQPRATAVQALAIPASLSPTRDGRALVVGAETGSGKTLAYLIPMLQRLKEEEDAEATRAIAANDVVEAVVTQMITVGGGSSDVPTASDATVRALASSRLRKLRRPRAIVLVPTRELVTQVLDVAKRLCGHSHGGGARLAVVGMHARPADPKRLRERLGAAPIDVLITTPSALRKRVDAGELLLGRVTEVVVDEADTLMDEGFTTELDDVLLPMWEAAAAREAKVAELRRAEDGLAARGAAADPAVRRLRGEVAEMNAAPPLITYVTATLPLSMTRRITKVHPTHSTVVTPSLHRTLPRLHQRFLRVAPGGAPVKNQLLLEVVKRAATSGDRRMIVFCNTRESAAAVHSLLRRQTATEGGGDGGGGGGTLGELNSMATWCALVTAETDPKLREAALRSFRVAPRLPPRRLLEAAAATAGADAVDGAQGLVEGEATEEEEEAEDEEASDADVVRILVATDVASRGLDTGAADHVVLYDFPLTAIDYLHRVGRTARNGRPGRATSLVGTRDAKLAESIERAVSKGAVLA